MNIDSDFLGYESEPETISAIVAVSDEIQEGAPEAIPQTIVVPDAIPGDDPEAQAIVAHDAIPETIVPDGYMSEGEDLVPIDGLDNAFANLSETLKRKYLSPGMQNNIFA